MVTLGGHFRSPGRLHGRSKLLPDELRAGEEVAQVYNRNEN